MKRDRTHQRQCVGDSLRYLDAGFTPKERKQQNGRNEKDALTSHGQEGGRQGFAHDLFHHIAHDDPTLAGECDALKAKRRGTAIDDSRIITEPVHHLPGKYENNCADNHQEDK